MFVLKEGVGMFVCVKVKVKLLFSDGTLNKQCICFFSSSHQAVCVCVCVCVLCACVRACVRVCVCRRAIAHMHIHWFESTLAWYSLCTCSSFTHGHLVDRSVV